MCEHEKFQAIVSSARDARRESNNSSKKQHKTASLSGTWLPCMIFPAVETRDTSVFSLNFIFAGPNAVRRVGEKSLEKLQIDWFVGVRFYVTVCATELTTVKTELI